MVLHSSGGRGGGGTRPVAWLDAPAVMAAQQDAEQRQRRCSASAWNIGDLGGAFRMTRVGAGG
jgi:hypothetical protein